MAKKSKANYVLVIAHYGIGKKISQKECEQALKSHGIAMDMFIDLEICNSSHEELYHLPYENLALAQQRKYNEEIKPLLEQYPGALVVYFGLTPIPLSFHLGYLIGNLHTYLIFQWHHQHQHWFADQQAPTSDHQFLLKPVKLPKEEQKGKGEVVIRVSTSYVVDAQSTYEVIPNPENEFDIALTEPHVDSLYNQTIIAQVVASFQTVLDAYANQLIGRDKIHLFISASAGLPFALGTRINPTVFPFVQTYQYSRKESPQFREAVLIASDRNDRIALSESEKKAAQKIRKLWNEQLNKKIKSFIKAVAGKNVKNWLSTISESDEKYKSLSVLVKSPWDGVIDISKTYLSDDIIDEKIRDIRGGFEYSELTNSWLLDDGFLVGLQKRLAKKKTTDISQAGRLFLFHEALHYSKYGHNLTQEIAEGIGQFPKVIEEADYQADVWGLLTEYRYCQLYETDKLDQGVKVFFCNAIDTAVETMWSFLDSGRELPAIQIRSMNRFLNWYWQYVLIENISGKGKLEEVVKILFSKPVIEFAGLPMDLREHRTFYRLDRRRNNEIQLAAFAQNRVFRFAPTSIENIVDGFKTLNGEKIKVGLKSFQVSMPNIL